MDCRGLTGSILFSFGVVHRIKVNIPPFGLLEAVKYKNNDTYLMVSRGLVNAAALQSWCEKVKRVWKDVNSAEHLQIRGLLSWLGVFSCSWNRSIFLLLKLLRKFHKSCTRDPLWLYFSRNGCYKQISLVDHDMFLSLEIDSKKNLRTIALGKAKHKFLGARAVLPPCLWCCNCEVACDLIIGILLFALWDSLPVEIGFPLIKLLLHMFCRFSGKRDVKQLR